MQGKAYRLRGPRRTEGILWLDKTQTKLHIEVEFGCSYDGFAQLHISDQLDYVHTSAEIRPALPHSLFQCIA